MTSTSVDPAADLLRERAAHYAAQAALFLRDQALSTASHDLRSPLNAMHSWAYVLERQLANADPNLQRALAGIRTGIDQQVALIDGVLDAPRAETRTLALAPRPFALRALLDETIALVRFALADARQVALDTTLPDGEPSLTVDRERVAQALWTLLTTAVEASAAGSRVAFACTRDGVQFTAYATCTVNRRENETVEIFELPQPVEHALDPERPDETTVNSNQIWHALLALKNEAIDGAAVLVP